MAGYAVGLLHDVDLNDDITAYLERIDDTLAPFSGRFIIHGGAPDVREGEFRQTMIVIEFPDTEAASAWYESAPYQAILPMRTANAQGVVFVIDGVDADHRATDVLP
ncbi:MAG: DUF1330 domain-containing protein [Acidimicrobiales bacterium]